MSCDRMKCPVCADISRDIKAINCRLTNAFRCCSFLIKEGDNEELNLTKDHTVKAYKILQGKL